MGNHQFIRAFYVTFVFALASSGCQSLHPATPVDVQVRDAETKAPIGGAQVRAWHPSVHSTSSSGTTGPDGMARIQSPPADDSPLNFEAMAKGYLPWQAGLPIERTSTCAVLEMYAEPRPVLELIVPTAYRGVVKATIRVQNDLKFEPHLRLFSFSVPASGAISVVLPPVFLKGITPDVRARYADGTPLPRDAKDSEIGCRWLRSNPESDYLFVIGTQWEADEIRRDLKKAETGRNQLGEESITGLGRIK